MVKPVIIIGLDPPIAVIPVETPPISAVTVYTIIGLPFAAGAVKLTVAELLPGTALTAVGAPGTEEGTTAVEGVEAGLVPIALVAVTVNVYDVPLVKPVTVIGLAAPVLVNPPAGLEVTV